MNKMEFANGQVLLEKLGTLGLSRESAKIFIELTRVPSTHLQLSRETGINRTKVYRVVAALEKRGLVARRTDDRGTFLVASDIAGLEVKLIEREEKIKSQRSVLQELAVELAQLKERSAETFFVQTYEGASGYRQMCWHELAAKGDLLVLGNGTVEEEASDGTWSRKHREKQIEAGYRTLEITNYDYGTNGTEAFTAQELLGAGLYEHRRLLPEILEFDGQTVIYNDTVAVYHWKHERKVGIELVSSTYAQMMRNIFYQYWDMAKAAPPE